jgi:BetR domain
MNQPGVQQIFFQHIKANLAAHLSLVDEVADLLSISNDSAYRRIRGEKPLSFEEIKTLCAHYKVSLDQLLHLNNESYLFSGPLTNNDNFGIESYLDHLLQQVNYFNSFEHRELIYNGKDLFLFHCFGFHELTVFKIFFWMKTILQYPIEGKEIALIETIRESVFKIISKMSDAFNRLPLTEIWHDDSVNASLRQVDYYRQSRIFPSEEHALKVYQNMLEMVDHIEKQAEAGCKFPIGGKPNAASVPYKFYYNEFMLGDNCNLAVLNSSKIVYINHSVLSIMMTKDPVFTEYVYHHLQNIMRKSTLMSQVGEKDRRKYFNFMREKIESRIKTF